MPRQATTLRELAQVRADNRNLLNAVVGNQGTALGRKNFTASGEPSGDPCIIIYMPHKIHLDLLAKDLRIPEKLTTKDGEIEAVTDVVVTTVLNVPKQEVPLSPGNQDLVNMLQWRDGTLDHLPPGAQIGAAELSAEGISTYVGTLGFAVRSKEPERQIVGFLTNQHVGGTASRSMYIPGAGIVTLTLYFSKPSAVSFPDASNLLQTSSLPA